VDKLTKNRAPHKAGNFVKILANFKEGHNQFVSFKRCVLGMCLYEIKLHYLSENRTLCRQACQKVFIPLCQTEDDVVLKQVTGAASNKGRSK
jgi:hypothetical protein